MNKEEFQKYMSKTKSFLSNKKVQWISVILLLLIVVISSSSIRLSNLDSLKDSTTGEYIPLALDPFYFLREGQIILENGSLPECDEQRVSLQGCTGWSPEIMPYVLAYSYPMVDALFGITFRFYDVISPVIFYILGIGLFFALSCVLIRNKWISLGASSLLAFTSAYLYRTMAGFADHESIGMAALFLSFFIFTLAMKFLLDKKEKRWWTYLVWGVAVGLTSALVIGSWGGVSRFIFIVFPLTYFLGWLFSESKEKSEIFNKWIFYASWIISTLVFGLILSLNVVSYLVSTTGLISLAVLGFIVIDGLLKIYPLTRILKIKKEDISWKIPLIILLVLILVVVFSTIFSLISIYSIAYILLAVLNLLLIFDCYHIASKEGFNKTWAVVLGILFSPISWIVYSLKSKSRKSYILKIFNEKFRILHSLVATGILGFFGMFFIGKNPFKFVGEIISYLLHPFGTSRVGLTVAENAQPYLSSWISNTGEPIFWLFVFGVLLLGFYLSKNIRKKKHKWGFFGSYVLMIAGILFSRISASSVLNGESFLSRIFYFIPLLWFWIYFFYLYINKNLKWSTADSFIFSFVFFTLISGRAALRMFFAITPFVCFMAAYFVFNLIKEFKVKKKESSWYLGLFGGLFLWFLFSTFAWWNGAGWMMLVTWVLKIIFLALILISAVFLYKDSEIKEDLAKVLLLVGILISVFALVSGISQSAQVIAYSAQYTGPSANSQWQTAMEWVRENTPTDSVFNHWWDYGYWIETLGERATISDGGHFQGEAINHNVGRYVLTTPNPDTAYSFLKTMGVDYFLIDYTDLGKYGAYSKIGSDDEWDRYSFIPIGTYDKSQIQETANETTYIYNIQGIVDEDLIYEENGQKIFLPGPTYDEIGDATYNTYLIGIIFKMTGENLAQPIAVYYYNGKQYQIPVRYVYAGGQIYDFGSGYEAVLDIIPSMSSTGLDSMGAMIYLSPKVKDSLFAQLYLLDDVFGNYGNFELVHEEDTSLMKSLKLQGYSSSEFIYYSGTFLGPIKIYDVSNYPEGTPVYEEFGEPNIIEYAYMDDYFN